MKRPPQSFVVEHKLRPRRAKDAPASIWSGDVGRELRNMLRADAEMPADRTEGADARSAVLKKGAGADSTPPKRILEVQVRTDVESRTEAPPEPTEQQPRRRKPAAVEIAIRPAEAAEPEVRQPAEPSEPPAEAPVPSPLRSNRPSYRKRREAARKSLPLAERWRWNKRY